MNFSYTGAYNSVLNNLYGITAIFNSIYETSNLNDIPLRTDDDDYEDSEIYDGRDDNIVTPQYVNFLISSMSSRYNDVNERDVLNLAEMFEQRYNNSVLSRIFNNSVNGNRMSFLTNENELYAKRYTDHEYEEAKKYFSQIYKEIKNVEPVNLYVSRSVLNAILEGRTISDDINNEEVKYPSYDRIIDNLYRLRCNCVMDIPERNVKNTLRDYVLDRGNYPNCQEFFFITEFHTLNNRIPTDTELDQYVNNYMQFSRSPEDYYQKDKMHTPVLGIEKLPIKIHCEGDINCSICQEEFKEGDKKIIVKPCNHEFHYDKDKCLGDASILDWFNCNNYCPLCKTKVSI